MVDLTGWRRFELNMLISFGGVTEANFDSIMRRSCVSTLKGKFVSPGKIQEMGGDVACGAQGIFTRDPSLKAFLKSPEAADAMLRAAHGFAQSHSLADCERIAEELSLIHI